MSNMGALWHAATEWCKRQQLSRTWTISWARKLPLSLAVLTISQVDHKSAFANDVLSSVERPAIKANRWQEDWSPFAGSEMQTQPLDGFKYIPLFENNPDSYISFGLNLRENFESSDAPAFGTLSSNPKDSYWLQRLQFHIDAHLNENWQLFTQLEDVRAFNKTTVSFTDASELDLRLAFLGYTQETDAWRFYGLISQPVVYESDRPFDDASSGT